MEDKDIRRLAGHPDCVPSIYIDGFVAGYKACINMDCKDVFSKKRFLFCTICTFSFIDEGELIWTGWRKWNKYKLLEHAEEGLKNLRKYDSSTHKFAIVPIFLGSYYKGNVDVYGNELDFPK